MNHKHQLSLKKRTALEISRIIQNQIIKSHPLKQLFWECTLRCNLHCQHCGSDCHKEADIADMPAEDFLRAIDSITPHVNPHQVMIIITGGEPLMRKDLESIGLELYKREYPWGMVSNGLALTPERLQNLIRSGLRAVTISLDGFEEAHNWLRGHPKSYAHAMRAIEMLGKQDEVIWDVVTCVNKRNIGHLTELREHLISKGLKSWRLFTVFPVGRAAEHPELQLTDQEFVQMMDFIAYSRKHSGIKVSYGCEGYLGHYEGEVRDNFFFCQAGVTVGSILHDGQISACPSIRADYNQGSIYTDDFMDVWTHKFEQYRDRSWMKKIAPCDTCKHFRYCRGNGMHLRKENGELIVCHLDRVRNGGQPY